MSASHRFEHAFNVRKGDILEYQFYMQNTTFTPYKYLATVQLFAGASEDTLTSIMAPIKHDEVEIHARPHHPAHSPAGTQIGPFTGRIDAGNLTGGLYTLKFTLYQNSVAQDVKYLSFLVAHPEVQVYGWHLKDMRARYDELWDQGWRLHILNTCAVNNQPLYNAVWRPSTEGEIQIYGWRYEDLRAKYDELWEQGLRLHILNAFVVNNQPLYNAVWRPSRAS